SDAELAALFGTRNTAPSLLLRVHKPAPRRPGQIGAPLVMDWVLRGAVTPVSNQGQCGSCWAFSAAEVITGAYFLATGTLVPLSTQQLVSCDGGDNNGCNGGLPSDAFDWVRDHGICALSSYSYTSGFGTSGACQT
ncbi:hypothetical protein T492DRAFT_1119873, partial [Pavlovales sp. CCMP2436]